MTTAATDKKETTKAEMPPNPVAAPPTFSDIYDKISADAWTDVLGDLKEHVAELPEWEVRLLPGSEMKELMSAPEVGDPKTDLGLGWKDNLPLADLVAQKKVPDVAKLSEDDLLNFMDTFMGFEALLLSGRGTMSNTVLSCIYAHDPALSDGNEVLCAFIRGALKSTEEVVTTITNSEAHDDDEFPLVTFGDNRVGFLPAVTLQEVHDTLETAISKSTSPAIKARLSFRKMFLQVLEDYTSFHRPTVVQGTHRIASCLEALNAISRDGEYKVNEKAFRNECSTWLPLSVPSKMGTPLPFTEAKKVFATLLNELLTVGEFLNLDSFLSVTLALEGFGVNKPTLLSRCLLSNMVTGCRFVAAQHPLVPNIDIARGVNPQTPYAPAISMILKTLSDVHGAPIYGQLMGGNDDILSDLVNYRYSLLPGATAQDISNVDRLMAKRQVLEALQQWLQEGLANMYVNLWSAQLKNRGRYHRALANMVPRLADLQNASYNLDTNFFCAINPMGTKTDEQVGEWRHKSIVCTAMTLEVSMIVQQLYVVLTTELNLHTDAEILPTIWIQHRLDNMRAENYSPLVIPTMELPAARHRKGGVPLLAPTVTTRRFSSLPHTTLYTIEIVRNCHSSMYALGCALAEAGLLAVALPEASATTAAVMFNHRFAVLRNQTSSGSLGVTYAACMTQYDEFKEMGKSLKFATSSFKTIVEKYIPQLKGEGGLDGIQGAVARSYERTVKANAVAIKMLAAKLEGKEGDELKAAVAEFKKQFSVSIVFVEGLPKIQLKPVV